jgi:hypothetical protein
VWVHTASIGRLMFGAWLTGGVNPRDDGLPAAVHSLERDQQSYQYILN